MNGETLRRYAAEVSLNPVLWCAQDFPTVSASIPAGFYKELLALPDEKTQHLPGNLLMLPGMPVMLTDNICTEQGLCNGTVGELDSVQLDPREPPHNCALLDGDSPRAIRLRYSPQCILVKLSKPNKNLETYDKLPHGVVPIFAKPIEQLGRKYFTHKGISIKRVQFPLVPCWATTDYKSQGATLDRVIVDLVGVPSRQPSQEGVYVSLSRVRTFEGLAIRAPFDHKYVCMERRRATASEELRLVRLQSETRKRFGLPPFTSTSTIIVSTDDPDAQDDDSADDVVDGDGATDSMQNVDASTLQHVDYLSLSPLGADLKHLSLASPHLENDGTMSENDPDIECRSVARVLEFQDDVEECQESSDASTPTPTVANALVSIPKPHWLMRIVDYWGFNPAPDQLQQWAVVNGFSVTRTQLNDCQLGPNCGYIASRVCTMLRSARCLWRTIDTFDACQQCHIVDGNMHLFGSSSCDARWLTGDQIISLITHWSPDVTTVGNKTSHYVDGPFSLDNFYTSIMRHMGDADANLGSTSLRYAIVNTDVAGQPGVHWFVVAYCVGSDKIPALMPCE